jgi:voltage-gated potassium channel
VLERAARDRDDQEPATRAQVRALMARIEELSARPPGGAAGPGAPPSGDDRPGG